MTATEFNYCRQRPPLHGTIWCRVWFFSPLFTSVLPKLDSAKQRSGLCDKSWHK